MQPFNKKPLAPKAIARATEAGLSNAENSSTGKSGLSSLMRPKTVRPSPSGMRTSSSTTLTSVSRAMLYRLLARADLGNHFDFRTLKQGFYPWRMISWSSATSKRILASVGICGILKKQGRSGDSQ